MTKGAPCTFKRKLGLKGRKLQGRQIDGEKRKKKSMNIVKLISLLVSK